MKDKYHIRHQRQLLLTRLLNQFQIKNKDRLMNIKNIIEKYIQNFSENLKMGRGMVWISTQENPKTNLSFFITNCLFESGFRSHYEANLNFLDFLNLDSLERFEEFYPDASFSDLLVIDGLDEKNIILSEERRESLYQLLLRRSILDLPIFFLTRFSVTEIRRIYGEKISDQLFSRNNGFIHFDFPT